MTIGGWIFMVCSITAVVSLISFCFYKVLTSSGATERMHAPLDIDTRDLQ